MRRLRLALLTLLITLGGLAGFGLAGASAMTPVGNPAVVFASTAQENACAGLSEVDGTQSCGTGETSFAKVVKAVVRILSLVVGVVAVIMVIVSGLKYITSSGDANNVNSAKNTLIYALVGIAIAALAQFMVRFVLGKTT